MLQSLSVKNYAIIDSLDIEFSEGLNILTGETGAGKSIIIGALSLALGYRASNDAIRPGADRASVTAVFTLDEEDASEEMRDLLDELDIDSSEGELILRRNIFSSGRNSCRINDTAVSVNTLRRLSELLIDIHGQHEHQKLMKPSLHLSFLDAWAGDELLAVLRDVQSAYEKHKDLSERLIRMKESARETARRRVEYETAVKEITAVAPKAGEDEAIASRVSLLGNAEKLFSLTGEVAGTLYFSDSNISEKLNKASLELSRASVMDEFLAGAVKSLEEAVILIDEVSLTIRDYRHTLEFEPEEMDKLHLRLSRINELKRKYAEDIPSILAYLKECEEALALSDNAEATIAKAEYETSEALSAYLVSAKKLSSLRKDSAGLFASRIMEILKDLAMPNARFAVSIESGGEKIAREGIDTVVFLISTNPGQAPRELSRVASGGEISRIMLAIKTIMAQTDKTGVLIFDEIDTGISGRTAQIVAQKLYTLSASHQIFAITHLPQIAAMADNHYLIEKRAEEDRTFTSLSVMDERTRTVELARMLGGVQVTELTLQNADEVLKLAGDFKRKEKEA